MLAAANALGLDCDLAPLYHPLGTHTADHRGAATRQRGKEHTMPQRHLVSTFGWIVVICCLAPSVFAAGDHLLLTELAVTPTEGEFVEIHNPTSSPIDLTNAYLTDATYAAGGSYYYNIVTGANAGGGDYYDFHARFPSGATIGPGEYQTVAITGSDNFISEHGILPTYELYEDGASADAVPDMLPAFPDSIALPSGPRPSGLTNGGEVIILYSWDGASDLVADLDRVLWGDTAEAVDKTGVVIDSAYDGNDVTSAYLDDTPVASQIIIASDGHDPSTSWHRIDLTEGSETASGGNGITGNDETSEDLAVTWAERSPTPGEGAVAARELLLSEIVHGGSTLAAKYVELLNTSDVEVNLATVYLADVGNAYVNVVNGSGAGGGSNGDFNARFPDGSSLGPGESLVVAINGSDAFQAQFGVAPDFELYEDGVADGVPDLVEAVSGSINGQGELRGDGEALVLYFWDGASDLVVDLDYVVWGDRQDAVDKTGLTVDGPDGDAVTTAYADDTAAATQDTLPPLLADVALLRIDISEGTETASGGNGFDGNDETSENLSTTWQPGTPAPGISGWVINEIHADPDPDDGDANGSGSVSTADDEFVELVNVSGSEQDLSGWTLADGYSVRHTFPPGSVVAADCTIVVFGDGPIIGEMGGAVVQEASSGGLGLNNGGDTVFLRTADGDLVTGATYGSIGGDNQSITLDPDISGGAYVKHSTATGSAGALFSPGTLIDGSAFSGCSIVATPAEIWEIQGSGFSSPFEYQRVATTGVVTASRSDGFFLQTDPGDGDPMTSDGLWVQVEAGHSLVVGDLVEVTGQVVEYYGMTEIANPSNITVLATAQPVPDPVLFDATTPSTTPTPVPDLERFEGMLVQVVDALVTGATNKWGDTAITLQPERAFVEPGAPYPGVDGHPEILVYDGNPEVFEFAPYQLGAGSENLAAGSTVSATGGLQFSFGDYQLWPTTYSVSAVLPSARAVRERRLGEMLIGSQNLFRLMPSDPAPEVEYTVRLGKIARLIVDVLRAPDVLAVQEVESSAALQDVADAVNSYDASITYVPYLETGNFPGDINIGFLVRDTLTSVTTQQVGKTAQFSYNGSDYDLFSRPPLVLHGTYAWTADRDPITLDVTVVAVHLRSRGSIETDEFARVKRWEQAEWLADYLEALQLTDENVVVIGDFNAFQFSDGFVDTLGILTGDPDASFPALIPGSGAHDPALINRVEQLPADERYSFVFVGSAEALDHALVSEPLLPHATEVQYGRANADVPDSEKLVPNTPLRAADHDGLVLYVSPVPSSSGVCDVNLVDGCEAADLMEVLRVLDDAAYTPAGNPNVDGIGDVTVDDLLALIGGLF